MTPGLPAKSRGDSPMVESYNSDVHLAESYRGRDENLQNLGGKLARKSKLVSSYLGNKGPIFKTTNSHEFHSMPLELFMCI